MDIPVTLGAPRHCKIGGNIYWVRPMTMLAIAAVMQWLDDVLPGRSERKMPPKIGDEASQRALQSFPGQVMLASLAMAPHGFSYAQAAELVPMSPYDDDNEDKCKEWIRLHDVYLARRRTMVKLEGGGDWSESWLDAKYFELARQYGLAAIGNLTIDQFDWLCSGGDADSGAQYDLAAIVADFEANTLPKIKAAQAAGTMEEYGEPERPAVIKMAMDAGLIEEIPPWTP